VFIPFSVGGFLKTWLPFIIIAVVSIIIIVGVTTAAKLAT
jgi:hypothetical protein